MPVVDVVVAVVAVVVEVEEVKEEQELGVADASLCVVQEERRVGASCGGVGGKVVSL